MFSLLRLFHRRRWRTNALFFLGATALTAASISFAQEPSRGLAVVPKDGVKRALLVGVDDYAEFADLKYAVADVEAVRAKLLELGFKPENIVELKSTNPANLRPSQRYIRRHVDALLKAAGPNDLLFLHFSGHGFQSDDVVRFAPEDAVATGDEQVVDAETTISLTEIIERLEASKAKFKWLIVDACRENPTGTRSAAASARAMRNIDPPEGMLVLQSCSAGELSYEDPDAGCGLFTGRLIEAFDGKADFDGDGVMSAIDVCKYVAKQTLSASQTRFNARQTPRMSAVDFGDFILAEDLKVDGLTREDWKRVETLYAEAFAAAQAKKFDEAKKQIADALEILADVAETDATKQRCLERQAMIELLANAGTSTDVPSNFDRVVSTASELVDAIENASDGDVIALEDGTYRLSEEITLKNKELTLVGKSGNRERVNIVAKNSDTFQIESNVNLTLTDLTIESENKIAVKFQDNSVKQVLTASRCTFNSSNSCVIDIKGGHCKLTECDISSKSIAPAKGIRALMVGYKSDIQTLGVGSLIAQSCNVSGGIAIEKTSEPVRLENCEVNGQKDVGIGVYRGWNNSIVKRTRCEITDCTIYNCNFGVIVGDFAYAVVKGGKIQDCVQGAHSGEYADLELSEVKITGCETGIVVVPEGECEAKEVIFEDVDDCWYIYEDKGTATHNGRRMTDAD